jgi:unsaturated rhamnogalacturonyl hydrolase
MAGRALAGSLLAGLLALPASAQSLPQQSAVLSTAESVANYWIANDPWLPGVADQDWTGSTLMNGYLALYQATGNKTYLNYATTYATHYNYTLDGSDTQTFGDDYAIGETYFRLYQIGGSTNSNIIAHIKSDIDYQTGLGSSGYTYWAYTDELNMGAPSFALVSALENSSAVSAHMYQMYLHLKTTQNSGLNLWNTTDHLWYRDTSQENPKMYWSRAEGWACLMHAKMLQTLPSSDPHYAEYLSTFQQQMAAIIAVQRSDGMWNVDLANANDYPGPESTGSACFLYGLAYGIRTGVLSSATYTPALVKAWNGFVNVAVHPSSDPTPGMLGYIQGTGSEPSSRQPVNYDNTNVNHTGGDNRNGDYGYGLFLLGASELSKIALGAGVAAPSFSPAPGAYTSGLTVNMTDTTSGATIRYTTDGSAPTETHGTVYSTAVSIASTTNLQAIAYESGMADSPVTSGTYTIGSGGTPITMLATGLSYAGSGASTSLQTDTHYNPDQWVELAATGTGQSITYTTASVPAGTYQLQMEWKGNNTRGELSLTVDSTTVTPNPLDQYSSGQTYPTTTFSPNLTFASAGTHKIKLTTTGKNSSSSGYGLSTYSFILTPE